jgi:hypothetical protein
VNVLLSFHALYQNFLTSQAFVTNKGLVVFITQINVFVYWFTTCFGTDSHHTIYKYNSIVIVKKDVVANIGLDLISHNKCM